MILCTLFSTTIFFLCFTVFQPFYGGKQPIFQAGPPSIQDFSLLFLSTAYCTSSQTSDFNFSSSPAILSNFCSILPKLSGEALVLFPVAEHSCTVGCHLLSYWMYVLFFVFFFRFLFSDYFVLHFHSPLWFILACFGWGAFCLKTFWIFEILWFSCFPRNFQTPHHHTGSLLRFGGRASAMRAFSKPIIRQTNSILWACWFRIGSYDP